MENGGRKRPPLGTASPSSLRSNQRRRGGGSNNDDERCIPTPKIIPNMNETQHPNLANSDTRFCSPSSLRSNERSRGGGSNNDDERCIPTPKIIPNMKENVHPKVANSGIFNVHPNRANSGIPAQSRSGMTQQTSLTNKINSTSKQFECGNNPYSILTPSEIRHQSVNLSGLTQQFPSTGRNNDGLIQQVSFSHTNLNQTTPAAFTFNRFHLPASIIHSTNIPHITGEPAHEFKTTQNLSSLTEQTCSTRKCNSTVQNSECDDNPSNSLTPSQRRLNAHNFPGLNHRNPLSQININARVNPHVNLKPFQLPASRISPKKCIQPSVPVKDAKYSSWECKLQNNSNKSMNLLNSQQRKKVVPFHMNHIGRKSVASQSSEKKADDITVLVPDLDHIGVRMPEWYQSKASGSGKNLMESFNRADVCNNMIKENSYKRIQPNLVNNTDNGHNDHTEHIDEDSSDIDADQDDTRGSYVNEDVDDNIRSKPNLWKGYMDLGPPTKKCTKEMYQMFSKKV
ncbi:hypothetical protein POM88_054436 [Heracleum sosnowskyi]|uniref:Uncharacterized protein n=1 Tax=Heracleum sosnowskyi TaxID=360622 RepID=A0AAD8GMB9_9APIA|nr:hypothetical protein POM88_054436 [Heracleum sosnowskyi]